YALLRNASRRLPAVKLPSRLLRGRVAAYNLDRRLNHSEPRSAPRRLSIRPVLPRGADKGAFDDLADRLPSVAVELHQPHLLDRAVVGRAGADGNAGQHDRGAEVLQSGRLAQDVLARQVVAALPQHLRQS